MNTYGHCEICNGCGRLLVEDKQVLPYGSTYATLRQYDETTCYACGGSGLDEYAEMCCFVCNEDLEENDLVIKDDYLIHKECVEDFKLPSTMEPEY